MRAKHRSIWMANWFALNDLRLAFRRNSLGPFWNTSVIALQAALISYVFSFVNEGAAHSYALHVSSGLVVWSFFIQTLGGAPLVFETNRHMLMQVSISPTIFSLRHFLLNLYGFGLTLIVFISVVLISGWADIDYLRFIVALALICGNVLWVSTFLSFVGLRVRDLAPVLNGFFLVLFFASPIIWTSERAGSVVTSLLDAWNPVGWALAVFRLSLNPGEGFFQPAMKLLILGIVGTFLTFMVVSKIRKTMVFFL